MQRATEMIWSWMRNVWVHIEIFAFSLQVFWQIWTQFETSLRSESLFQPKKHLRRKFPICSHFYLFGVLEKGLRLQNIKCSLESEPLPTGYELWPAFKQLANCLLMCLYWLLYSFIHFLFSICEGSGFDF